MASSKFQDVRANLNTLITARFTTDSITGVDVFEYGPTGNATREDQVWFGRITVDQEGLTMGGTSRVVGETLTIELSVRAPRSGGDQDDMKLAEQRAEAIWASIENAIRNGSTVNSTVMFSEIVTFESIPDFDAEGAIGTIEASIVAESNI